MLFSDFMFCGILALALLTKLAVEEDSAQNLVESGLVTVKDAARFLHISLAFTYELMARGDLPYTKLGRARRIPKKALIELAAKHLVKREE